MLIFCVFFGFHFFCLSLYSVSNIEYQGSARRSARKREFAEWNVIIRRRMTSRSMWSLALHVPARGATKGRPFLPAKELVKHSRRTLSNQLKYFSARISKVPPKVSSRYAPGSSLIWLILALLLHKIRMASSSSSRTTTEPVEIVNPKAGT